MLILFISIIAKMLEPAHLPQSSDKANEPYFLFQRSTGCADVFDLGFFSSIILSICIAKILEPAHLPQTSDKANESFFLIQRSTGCADVLDLGFSLIQRSTGCSDLFDLGFDLDVLHAPLAILYPISSRFTLVTGECAIVRESNTIVADV